MTAQETDLTAPLHRWVAECWGAGDMRRGPSFRGETPDGVYIRGNLTCGILATPYVEVYRDGVRRPDREVYTTRVVQTHRMSGYANQDYVLDQLDAGATVRLPSIEDWTPAARAVVDAVARACGESVSATACLSRAGAPADLPSRDGAPAVAVQCDGRTIWRIGAAEFETSPGDVVYLPRESAVTATAAAGDCVLLLVEGRSFSARQLVQAIQAAAQEHLDTNPVTADYHLLDASEKADRACAAVRRLYSGMSADDVVRYADDSR